MPTSESSLLELKHVEAFYGHIHALKGVSISVKKGDIVSVIGANGAGKSTLLRSISGLISSKRGMILYEGRDILKTAPSRLVKIGISQVPEGRQVFGHLRVIDNLRLGAYLFRKRSQRGEIRSRLERIYGIFPVLKDRSNQLAGTLSGGEQQMLAIGRALMSGPRLLLLDEPSMGLAPLLVKEIFQVFRALHNQGTTLLLVEQNAKAALRLADYGYVLETGMVVLEGEGRALLEDEKVKKAYLGG